MKVAYINPFLVALHEVFNKMVHVPLALGKPFLRSSGDHHYTLSAFVEVTGAVSGWVVFRLSQEVALALASGLAGEPVKALDADCVDAIGEIANMVTGSAKKELSERQTTTSLPKVLLGQSGDKCLHNGPVMVIPCDSKVGRFALEVSLRDAAPAPVGG